MATSGGKKDQPLAPKQTKGTMSCRARQELQLRCKGLSLECSSRANYVTVVGLSICDLKDSGQAVPPEKK